MVKFLLFKIITVLLICGSLYAGGNDSLAWHKLATLPPASLQNESLGVAGPFAGVSNGALIIAGGANFPKPYWQSSKKWHDDIWVLENYSSDSTTWQTGFTLDEPAGYGMSVTTEKGLVCLGGNDAATVHDRVIMLVWDVENKKIIKTKLPNLPGPCTLGSGVYLEGKIYIAGGQSGTGIETAMKNFWVLDLNEPQIQWRKLSPWPGSERVVCMLAVQHNGQEYCVYLMGGRHLNGQTEKAEFLKDVYEYSPIKNSWMIKADMPLALGASAATDVGQGHIFVFGGDDGSHTDKVDELKDEHPGFNNTIFAYHTITNTWTQAGEISQCRVTSTAIKTDSGIIISPGEIRPRVRTPEIQIGAFAKKTNTFGWVNYTALFIYLSAMLAVGGYFAKKNKDTEDYFRGGQKIPAVVAGLSMFATGLSSITFVAVPAKCYATDWTFIVVNFMLILVIPFAIFFVMPRFRKINATSAYEYLEQRFNLFVRLFAALSFILFQIGRMAIVMFLPALALSAITSLSVVQCILIMGILSVIYCTLGGLEAVVWTDAVQSVILLGGGLLSFFIIVNHLDGGFSEFVSIAQTDNKFRMVNWDFSKTSIFTSSLWVLVIGGIGQNLVPLVSDQATVQRYMAVSDTRAARKAMLTSLYVGLVATFLFFGIGTALYVFYKNFPQNLVPENHMVNHANK